LLLLPMLVETVMVKAMVMVMVMVTPQTNVPLCKRHELVGS
jgi:hypothetical protein